MASTASGWQYAVPTDTLVAWPAVSQAVADKLEISLPKSAGLQLVKSQTIGTGVSSVIVTNAFNATYPNYLITVSGTQVSNASDNLSCQMRTGTTTATSAYFGNLAYWSYTGSPGAASQNNASAWASVGRSLFANDPVTYSFNLLQPFAVARTIVSSLNTTGNDLTGQYTGYHQTIASYDQFVISCGGTFTGGTIYVYGYAKV